jgi:hypothetical protein
MAKNTNAKQEFLNHIGQKNSNLSGNSIRKVLCASIQKGDDYGDDDEIIERTFILTTGYTQEDWIEFISKLDFMYDSGYGGQEVFGTIWYLDGTWSERREYDGSEWWQYNECPEIPDSLKRLDKEREQKLNKIIDEK